MSLERERGITIKAQTVSLSYQSKSGEVYYLNLIDTPGHVDFSYEVSRSLAACEGALLVVDASQGVEAQTLANCYTAVDLDVTVLPVLNKIDLSSADPDRVITEIEDIIGIEAQGAVLCSAKNQIGIVDIMELIVSSVPSPKGDINMPLQALIIDSWFDQYVGVIMLVRVVNGILQCNDKIQLMSNKKQFQCEKLGVFMPQVLHVKQLRCGEVGFIIAGIKELQSAQVGDTVTLYSCPASEQLVGFKALQPKVFAGLYPIEANEYELLKESLYKLKLNDASLHFEPETSQALGFGFRCGFLGLLHMDIIQERLEREFNLTLITTAPTVIYEVITTSGELIKCDNPSKMPPKNKIRELLEPIISMSIIVPNKYIGNVITLCTQKRGIQVNITYSGSQVLLTYDMPLNEVVIDFFDKLKSLTKGYASFEYSFKEFVQSDLIKLDILINSNRVDALSVILHRQNVKHHARNLTHKLQKLIPRQMFDVAIQATIGSQIIARETVKAMRKNVLAKCYGGDITRKKKLLEKQKEGKKRMKQVGNVEIPQSAFLAILEND